MVSTNRLCYSLEVIPLELQQATAVYLTSTTRMISPGPIVPTSKENGSASSLIFSGLHDTARADKSTPWRLV